MLDLSVRGGRSQGVGVGSFAQMGPFGTWRLGERHGLVRRRVSNSGTRAAMVAVVVVADGSRGAVGDATDRHRPLPRRYPTR